MTNFKILLAMGALVILAALVAKITFSRNRVFPLPISSLTRVGATPLPSPTIAPANQKEEGPTLVDFRYPGAEIVSLGGHSLSLKSADTVEAITAWYKQKLTGLNLNIRNFIQTNTNDSIANRLSGVNEKRQITVQIDKEETAASVKIIVTIRELNE
ncbi:MAG TPA: hypothetical protein VMW04_03715 [Patescibacteria group bacterium]|nr:hypothetical protein [Patescibacteria group bacterium]